MGTHDSETLKSEADILARSSRPQRNSTWVPKTRDWRYATGIIQHDDDDGAPTKRSIWDTLDRDYQAGLNKQTSAIGSGRSRSGTGSDVSMADTTEVHTPGGAISEGSTRSPEAAAQPKGPYKPMEFRKGVWWQVAKFKRTGDTEGEDARDFEATGLVVRFRFTRKHRPQIKQIMERPVSSPPTTRPLGVVQSPLANQNPTPPTSSPRTPAAARTAESVRSLHVLDSIESLYTFPLFQRIWVDETHDYKVKVVRATLRPADAVVHELGANYEWYDSAVRVDAIFPPGVPLSAKEIHAFYPHHVRWKDVMVRLTNNDYRGADIMAMQAYFRGAPTHHIPPASMNNFQRDTVKSALPGFKTASYKGKSDRNLCVGHLKPGPYIENTRPGFTLPTFEALVRGLNRLPSGLDARGLTQCLSWYLNMRDSFTPMLEMNVLHAQSLIRALRQPLKPFGPQNLDRNALQEWRSKGTFETVDIEEKEHDQVGTVITATPQHRTQMHLNLDKDEVSMNLTLPIRHVLTFPFLALHGVMAEALKMGIEKAEIRKHARAGSETTEALEEELAAKSATENDIEASDGELADKASPDIVSGLPVPEEAKKPYRIPKRPRPEERDSLPGSKRSNTPSVTDPRQFAPEPSQSQSRPPSTAHLSRSWNTPAPSSAYAPPRREQDSVYGRRDYADRQPAPDRGGGRQNGRSNASGGSHDRARGYESRHGDRHYDDRHYDDRYYDDRYYGERYYGDGHRR